MLDGVNDQEQHAHQLGNLLEMLKVVSFFFPSFYLCFIFLLISNIAFFLYESLTQLFAEIDQIFW